MKTYARHRSSDELIVLAQGRGIVYDATKLATGSDYMSFALIGPDGPCLVMYNVFNGRFFCASEGFTHFSSDDEKLDGQPWFDTLLDFFYTDEALPK